MKVESISRVYTGILFVLLGLALTWNVVTGYECGPKSDNKKCEGEYAGYCCSQYGYCGKTARHCGEKCQLGYGLCGNPAKESECGKDYYGKNCTGERTGQCCSKYGNCGTTEAYCGEDCQSESGPCGKPAADNQCGPKFYGKLCTGAYAGQCCGSDGYCGKSEPYCGRGCQPKFGPCGSADPDENCGIDYHKKNCTGDYAGQCCSSSGTCGKTDKECSTGCQLRYGPCKSPAEDKNCGTDYWGKKCTGVHKGQCCSKDGVCGTTKEFCGTGCQPEYGTCKEEKKENCDNDCGNCCCSCNCCACGGCNCGN